MCGHKKKSAFKTSLRCFKTPIKFSLSDTNDIFEIALNCVLKFPFLHDHKNAFLSRLNYGIIFYYRFSTKPEFKIKMCNVQLKETFVQSLFYTFFQLL